MNWETSNKRRLIIAHRGDTQAGLENTLPAIESALSLGVDGIEVDLRLTGDGQVAVFHDEDLRRLGGTDERIQCLSLSELRQTPLTGNSRIPALEDLLELVRDRCLLNLEIKTGGRWDAPGDGSLEKKIAEILRRFSLSDSILVSSFHPLSLWRMRRLAPHLRRGVLFESKYALHRMLLPFTSPFSINAPLSRVDSRFVRAVHDAGRRFLVWTVDGEDDMKMCLETGVDGIITDEPRRLKALLERSGGG